MPGPQHPEFSFGDGDVITISNRDAKRLIDAMQTLAANAGPDDTWIPYDQAIARIEGATQLHHTTVVDLHAGEDTAALRALEQIEADPASHSSLARLRRALLRNGANDV